jgi:hypothetical protein
MMEFYCLYWLKPYQVMMGFLCLCWPELYQVMTEFHAYDVSMYFPIQITMNLTFEQAARGCDKEVRVNVTDTCPKCRGDRCEPGTKKVVCTQCAGTGMVSELETATPEILNLVY